MNYLIIRHTLMNNNIYYYMIRVTNIYIQRDNDPCLFILLKQKNIYSL